MKAHDGSSKGTFKAAPYTPRGSQGAKQARVEGISMDFMLFNMLLRPPKQDNHGPKSRRTLCSSLRHALMDEDIKSGSKVGPLAFSGASDHGFPMISINFAAFRSGFLGFSCIFLASGDFVQLGEVIGSGAQGQAGFAGEV